MSKFFRSYTVLLALVLLLLGIGGNTTPVMAQQKSLYDRLGGQPAIQAVVDEFLKNVAADNRINKFFANTDLTRLNKLLVEQICQVTGGPCTYTGRSMKETHMGLGITDADFKALVEDLVKALDKFKVPDQEKNELLGILGPLEPDIVEVPATMPQTGASIPEDISKISLISMAGIVLLGAGWFLWKKQTQA